MSTHICGCDPEARHHCSDYPRCAWGRVEAGETGSYVGIVPKRGTGEPMSMTLQRFQTSIARTYRPSNPACHGLGVAGEAGKVADIIKKELFHDAAHDFLTSPRRDDMRKELGDVLWYIAAVASDWGFTLDEVAQANIDKLAKRYPNGFEKGGGVHSVELDELKSSGRCTVAQPAGWRCIRQAHTGFCAVVSESARPEIVGGIDRSTVRLGNQPSPIRLPKRTFRAIRSLISHPVEATRYEGRPSMLVCATLFEEGDE